MASASESVAETTGQQSTALAEERAEAVYHGAHFRAAALVGMGDKPELLLNLGHRVAGADKIGVAVTKGSRAAGHEPAPPTARS